MDQHIQLSLTFNGLDKVSIKTDLGWTDRLSVSVDCIHTDDALTTAKLALKSYEALPHCNDAINQEYANKANEHINDLLSKIESLDNIPPTGIEFALCDFFELRIKFEKSYTVYFGEKSAT